MCKSPFQCNATNLNEFESIFVTEKIQSWDDEILPQMCEKRIDYINKREKILHFIPVARGSRSQGDEDYLTTYGEYLQTAGKSLARFIESLINVGSTVYWVGSSVGYHDNLQQYQGIEDLDFTIAQSPPLSELICGLESLYGNYDINLPFPNLQPNVFYGRYHYDEMARVFPFGVRTNAIGDKIPSLVLVIYGNTEKNTLRTIKVFPFISRSVHYTGHSHIAEFGTGIGGIPPIVYDTVPKKKLKSVLLHKSGSSYLLHPREFTELPVLNSLGINPNTQAIMFFRGLVQGSSLESIERRIKVDDLSIIGMDKYVWNFTYLPKLRKAWFLRPKDVLPGLQYTLPLLSEVLNFFIFSNSQLTQPEKESAYSYIIKLTNHWYSQRVANKKRLTSNNFVDYLAYLFYELGILKLSSNLLDRKTMTPFEYKRFALALLDYDKNQLIANLTKARDKQRIINDIIQKSKHPTE